MFFWITQENANVTKLVCDHMREDLQRVYSQDFESARKQWFAMQNHPVGKATQKELLRFRGGSTVRGIETKEDTLWHNRILGFQINETRF